VLRYTLGGAAALLALLLLVWASYKPVWHPVCISRGRKCSHNQLYDLETTLRFDLTVEVHLNCSRLEERGGAAAPLVARFSFRREACKTPKLKACEYYQYNAWCDQQLEDFGAAVLGNLKMCRSILDIADHTRCRQKRKNWAQLAAEVAATSSLPASSLATASSGGASGAQPSRTGVGGRPSYSRSRGSRRLLQLGPALYRSKRGN